MYKHIKILAIIPARSGSKGLKDKNIKLLQGKPLIAHTIEAACQSNVFDEIIVSTDSKVYADIAIKYGASVPFLRPSNLAQDGSSSKDVITYTVEEMFKRGSSYDCFVLLQPTSPLRNAKHIQDAVSRLINLNANAIVSMSECEHSPDLSMYLDDTLSLEGAFKGVQNTGRQQLGTYYRLNGAIYCGNVDYYLKHGTFYGERSFAYIMEKKYSIDIDDIYDFKYAETVLQMMSKEENEGGK